MMKIGVLVSGGGTNLQAIIDKVHGKTGEIAVVIANNPDAYGLVRAQKAGIATAVVVEQDCGSPEAFNQKMMAVLKAHDVELVVLAGFMRILTPAFVRAYPNRIVNIHPALIPSFCGEGFYGMHVHQAVYDYGVKVSGPTVHFVSEEADAGPIIAQRTVALDDSDKPEAIQKKVLVLEHELLPWVVEQICLGHVHVDGRRVAIDCK
ncbi:MAG: phosphoribosylglycinamide formyltransferase [Eubacteriaceae bacterium]|jgi:phosphoribosylglycinamide formyltransferase-1|nr:phosphoribosylglycinamide formyltransferase [Eubacteriaceae bacterium]MDD4507741.1 phosphoribosylglycinamide formyltransferase [Eubacteriaceae bacterium]